MRIVISYCASDTRWRNRLRGFLAPIENGNVLVELWDRACIQAGQCADSEAMAAFGRADLALVLVSARYLADRILMRNELPLLFANRRDRGLMLIPIILSPCLWERVPELKNLSPLPKNRIPLSQVASRDGALCNLAKEICIYAEQTLSTNLSFIKHRLVPLDTNRTKAGIFSSKEPTTRTILPPEFLPTSMEEKFIGNHRVLIEGDVVSVQFRGDVDLSEIVALQCVYETRLRKHPRLFSVFQVEQAGIPSLEVRKKMAEWRRDHQVAGTAVIGASLTIRTIGTMYLRAARLIGLLIWPVRFVESETEAQAFIDELRMPGIDR